MKLLLVLALFCSLAFAQSAKVVELPKHDADQAKKLYEAKLAADKAWEDFNSKLKESYKDLSAFEFSEDFRFIVPKPWTVTSPSTCWPTILSPGTIIDPNVVR